MPDTTLDSTSGDPPERPTLSRNFRSAILSKHDMLWNAIELNVQAHTLPLIWILGGNEELWVLAVDGQPSHVLVRAVLGEGRPTLDRIYSRDAIPTDPQLSQGFAEQVLRDFEDVLQGPAETGLGEDA
ncbi:MAG: hypothetical protein ABI877_16965 [Gemmatimonadaceae bacterium]